MALPTRRPSFRAAALPCLLPFLLLWGACATTAPGPVRLVFIPQDPKDAARWPDMVPAEAGSESHAMVRPGPFSVVLDLLDDAARKAYLHAALGREGDPFGPDETGQARFVSLRVEIHNSSKDDMTFNPQQMILVTDSPEYVEPLDATRLHEGLADAGPAADEFLRDMHKALYDTSVSLQPGESITRLLMIPFPHYPFHQAKLECAQFIVGQHSFSFDVPFAQAPALPPSGPGG